MSLINQVLSDLEKRGVSVRSDRAFVRVVPIRKNPGAVVWLIALMLALVASGMWWSNSESRRTTRAGTKPAPVLAGGRLPVPLAGVNAVQPSVPQAESPPVIVAAHKIPHEESRTKGEAKATGAAMHLSFELSSIPLPSSLRVKSVAAATRQSPNKAVLPTSAAQAKGTPPDTRPSGDPGAAPALHAPLVDESKVPVAAPVSAVAPAGSVDKQIKQPSVQQQADNEFRRASGLMQRGRINEAIAGYEAALQLDAGHDAARQAQVGLLLENKRNADAERVLQDGLKHNPKQSGFAMLLARMQVERNELALALDTLQKALPYAYQQADYQAFIAALLQRQGHHNEAISRYQIALQLAPNSGVWLMGLGLSLQAVQRNEEARGAFKSAIESRTLSAELQAFVEQRLKEL